MRHRRASDAARLCDVEETKGPVEVAAAHSNSVVVMVEGDDRRDDDIEHSRGYGFAARRLENAETVQVKIGVRRNLAKLHAKIIFAYRGKNALFHAPCARNDIPGIYLDGSRQVAANVFRSLKPVSGHDFFRDDCRRGVPRQIIERSASFATFLPELRLLTGQVESDAPRNRGKRKTSPACAVTVRRSRTRATGGVNRGNNRLSTEVALHKCYRQNTTPR